MIKRDIDACIMQAATYDSFLEMLSGMGYEIKNAYRSEGKYLAIKPMGLTRFRRCKSLGEDYKRAKLSGVQKRYFARLYRLGLIKKRPYSQAWKYRDELRKMQKLQEDYLFLVRHDIQTAAGVAAIAESMTDKKKDTSRKKSRIFKERAKMKPLFDMVSEMIELEEIRKNIGEAESTGIHCGAGGEI